MNTKICGDFIVVYFFIRGHNCCCWGTVMTDFVKKPTQFQKYGALSTYHPIIHESGFRSHGSLQSCQTYLRRLLKSSKQHDRFTELLDEFLTYRGKEVRPSGDDIHVTPELLLQLKRYFSQSCLLSQGALLLILGQADEILREDDERPLYLRKRVCFQAVALYYLKGLVCKI